MKVKDLVDKLSSVSLVGNGSIEVNGASTIYNPKKGTISFCKPSKVNYLGQFSGCAVFVQRDMNLTEAPEDNSYILTNNVRLDFVRAMRLVYPVIPKPDIKVGRNCQFEEGVILGSVGHGYERNESGEFEQFICVGGVQIGDNVVLGANTTVDRGTIDDTIIGDGTKIDNLVHIAHNVKVGKHCDIRATAMLAGSCTIGDYVVIAPGAQINNGITIGDNAFIGMGAVVMKDIPAGEVWAGVPARKLRDNEKIYGAGR